MRPSRCARAPSGAVSLEGAASSGCPALPSPRPRPRCWRPPRAGRRAGGLIDLPGVVRQRRRPGQLDRPWSSRCRPSPAARSRAACSRPPPAPGARRRPASPTSGSVTMATASRISPARPARPPSWSTATSTPASASSRRHQRPRQRAGRLRRRRPGHDGQPASTAVPVISGSLPGGKPLTVTAGTWYLVATSYAYQWQRNTGSGFTDIAGANNPTYFTGPADVTATPARASPRSTPWVGHRDRRGCSAPSPRAPPSTASCRSSAGPGS